MAEAMQPRPSDAHIRSNALSQAAGMYYGEKVPEADEVVKTAQKFYEFLAAKSATDRGYQGEDSAGQKGGMIDGNQD